MCIRDRAYDRIRSISVTSKERYRVGISSQEGMERFLTASGLFQKKYPGVELYATDESTKNLLKKLNMWQLALIITSLDSLQKITLPYKVLNREEILLLVPRTLPYKIWGESRRLKWELLKNEHFILSKQNSTMRSITDHIFKQLGFNPDIVCELDNTSATIHMVAEGTGLAFLPSGLKVENEQIRYVSLTPKVLSLIHIFSGVFSCTAMRNHYCVCPELSSCANQYLVIILDTDACPHSALIGSNDQCLQFPVNGHRCMLHINKDKIKS